ncbi:unnamed protein product [Staurois parvus]|uniref:Uncharacterized protein n=1 Tax=Staurois parvus TaxID=386267 RepID=A0ABN9CEG6_9NEOB|nr:unnamed protein product [Staurois parvus]
MATSTWHFWGHTNHQGTLISALMISVHVPLLSSRAVSVTAREERNADNQHFRVYM